MNILKLIIKLTLEQNYRRKPMVLLRNEHEYISNKFHWKILVEYNIYRKHLNWRHTMIWSRFETLENFHSFCFDFNVFLSSIIIAENFKKLKYANKDETKKKELQIPAKQTGDEIKTKSTAITKQIKQENNNTQTHILTQKIL